MAIVLDASVALSFLLREARAEEADEIIRKASRQGGMVPTLFWLEVANGLRGYLRRGEIDSHFRDSCLRELGRIPLECDTDTAARMWEWVELSERRNLTPYDACYLELTLRRRAKLATFDTALAEAARAEGVLLPIS